MLIPSHGVLMGFSSTYTLSTFKSVQHILCMMVLIPYLFCVFLDITWWIEKVHMLKPRGTYYGTQDYHVRQ